MGMRAIQKIKKHPFNFSSIQLPWLYAGTLSSFKLDITLAKCQRATIQKQILIGNLKKQSCFVHVTFFVAKYSKQRQMS